MGSDRPLSGWGGGCWKSTYILSDLLLNQCFFTTYLLENTGLGNIVDLYHAIVAFPLWHSCPSCGKYLIPPQFLPQIQCVMVHHKPLMCFLCSTCFLCSLNSPGLGHSDSGVVRSECYVSDISGFSGRWLCVFVQGQFVFPLTGGVSGGTVRVWHVFVYLFFVFWLEKHFGAGASIFSFRTLWISFLRWLIHLLIDLLCLISFLIIPKNNFLHGGRTIPRTGSASAWILLD
jgi:hypothetical protein